ncbi:MAG: nuclear transport factor 2 family protein [Bacteriovorax sp.]|jgi:steroid delta-isomerase|nr:nuclear transport factor 2 family protein [Bacteriovorax sp.]
MKLTSSLIEWYKNLTLAELDLISNFYAVDVFFKDPFNEIVGLERVKRIFIHMFETLENPKFIFIDTIENENEAFLTWDFTFLVKGKSYKIHGSSHLKFNENKKIIYHRDYWDVGEELFLKIPLLKTFYHFFRSKLALPH